MQLLLLEHSGYREREVRAQPKTEGAERGDGERRAQAHRHATRTEEQSSPPSEPHATIHSSRPCMPWIVCTVMEDVPPEALLLQKLAGPFFTAVQAARSPQEISCTPRRSLLFALITVQAPKHQRSTRSAALPYRLAHFSLHSAAARPQLFSETDGDAQQPAP